VLELFHIYEHGIATLPLLAALKERGFFEILADEGTIPGREICRRMKANSGHFEAVLRTLESLRFLSRDAAGNCSAGPRAAVAQELPGGVLEIAGFPFASLLSPDAPAGMLSTWTARSACRWDMTDPLLAQFADGLIAIPLLLALKEAGLLDSNSANPAVSWERISGPMRAEVAGWFLEREWAINGTRAIELTPLGRFLVERAGITATTASYRPMFARAPDLLFGDCGRVFDRDNRGLETHVDRTMNVTGSGFQHKRFFEDMRAAVIARFESQPLEQQPRYIADMGCGDGSLLKTLYEAIRDHTTRGARLDQYPLTLIGMDFNEEALQPAAVTLRGLPHLLLTADIGRPQEMLEALRSLNLEEPENTLHVRSFLDHNRQYAPPAGTPDTATPAAPGVGVDETGRSIPPGLLVANLVEHLKAWSAVAQRHGLMVVEVHCLPPAAAGEFLEKTESLHFDLYHALSGQYLVEADTFLLAAAEAGLFARPGFSVRYPRTLPFSRITLDCFESRPYKIRLARMEDLPRLWELERACWPEDLRATPETIDARLRDVPRGQLILETENTVEAVLYSQRIPDSALLRSTPYGRIAELPAEAGSCVQLLGVNSGPSQEARGAGDSLLEFALHYFARMSGVESIAGLTRCARFPGGSVPAYAAYVAARNEQNEPADPILRFHWSHGAQIAGPVAAYREEDPDNLGHGVLIEYSVSEVWRRAGSKLQGAATVRQDPAVLPAAQTVHQCITEILGAARAEAYAPGRTLRDMGLDSLDLMEFKVLLGKRFGHEPDASFFFRYTTPDAIAMYFGEAAPEAIAPPVLPAASSPTDDAIAIVGIGCRFPGGVNGPREYWRLLRSPTDAVSEVPADRIWSDQICTRAGGFLRDVDCFDAEFFGISPREAVQMDPQQRMLLEVARNAMEDAAIDPRSLAGSRAGVFAGIFNNDYERLLAERPENRDLDIYYATGNARSVASGRLAYIFGLEGPALTVDTACSSSLVAVHLACRSLRAGECQIALTGGVNLILAPDLSVAFSRANMLSPDGKCKTFDAAADGYVRSEGCAVVVLKRVADALRDEDRIYALIRGTAVNQDGASNGLTAPSVRAQHDVIRRALADATLQPEDISYLEAHGTGTALGDPVEFSALEAVFGGCRSEGPLVLGSVKTNIGHTEAAAGIAGLIKLALSLEAGFIPAHLHYTAPNPHIDLSRIPALIPSEGLAWPRAARPRRAGVSSFGFSGTNAHVVVEEAPVVPHHSGFEQDPWGILPLSATSPAALRELVRRYIEFLDDAEVPSLDDICYTAATGRTHFASRLACVASSIEDLRRRLRIWEREGPLPELQEGIPSGLHALALAYQSGEDIDWPAQFPRGRHQKASVPTYPYRRTRFWFSERVDSGSAAVFPSPFRDAVRVPHSRDFVLNADYGTGRFPFLRDHLISGAIVVPAALQVLAGLAAAQAVAPGARCSLRDITFTRKLVMTGSSSSGIQWLVKRTGDATADFEIVGGSEESWVSYARGKIHWAAPGPMEPLDLAAIQSRCPEAVEPGPVYASLAESEIRLGPAFQTLDGIFRGEHETLGHIRRSSAPVHAAVVDACLQLALVSAGGQTRPMLPFRIESFEMAPSVDWNSDTMWSYVRFRDTGAEGGRLFDSYLLDGNGRVIARAGGVQMRDATQAKRSSDSLYHVSWQTVELPLETPAATGAAVLILGGPGGLAARTADALRCRGRRAVLANAEDYLQVFAAGKFRAVVHLLECDAAPDAGTLDEYQQRACGSLLLLVQSMALAGGPPVPRLWVVTRGAADPSTAEGVMQAPLLGLANVVAHEHPELRCVRVDLSGGDTHADRLADLLQTDPVESRLAYAAHELRVARLRRYSPDRPHLEFRLNGDAGYLITGGLGKLGLQLASWAASRGARHLILTGRSAPSALAQHEIAGLRRAGLRVVVERFCVGDAAQMQAVLERASQTMPMLKGVFHLAGIVDDGLLANLTWDRFQRVMEPKVQGAWNLHRLTTGLDLDHFVLFSSMASLLGTPGQGNYAAANAFLDGLAQFRRAMGLPGLSVNWGAWPIGVAEQLSSHDKARWSDWGVQPFDIPSALELLEQLLAAGIAQAGAISIDWRRYRRHAHQAGDSSFLGELLPADESAGAPPFLHKLVQAPPARRRSLMENYVRSQVSELLRFPSIERVQPNDGFFNLGIDSLMSMELKNGLDAELKLNLRTTVAFDFPSSAALANHLLARLTECGTLNGSGSSASPEKKPAEDWQGLEELSQLELRQLLERELSGR
jgi:acyl transferase domain-containing protein/acyl carrier protein